MTNFNFYDIKLPGTRFQRLLNTFRRILRRVQRPYFHRIRDLLTHQHHQHQEAINRMAAIESEQRLQRQVAEAAAEARHRGLLMDYLAMTRRLARIEDLLDKQSGTINGDVGRS